MCQALRSLDCEPGTVLDVGANQGQFAGAASWWYPRAKIVSFEPVPAAFSILKRNCLSIAGIELVATALGNEVGELVFFENEYSHASSALMVTETQRLLRPSTANSRKISVPVTTLDIFCAGRVWAQPILLKIDVQGFEKRVLEGASAFLPSVEFLLFECSFSALYDGEPLFQEMNKYVTSLGYELIAPVGFLENEQGVLLQVDLLWRRCPRT